MELRQFQISDSLEDIARIGVVFFKQVVNGPVSDTLREQMQGFAAEIRGSLAGRKLSELEPVARTRELYHRIGIDPTKDRPSSERLLRRVSQGKTLPKISKFVDAVNFASLKLQCPMGAYDWDHIVPPVLVRIGRTNEGYYGMAKGGPAEEHEADWIDMHGRLTLVDGEGLFGNPSQDSARTQVTLRTVRALVVAWAPASAPRTYLESAIQEVSELCAEYCDTKVAASGII